MFSILRRPGRHHQIHRSIVQQTHPITFFPQRNIWQGYKPFRFSPSPNTPFYEEVRRPPIFKSFLFFTTVSGLTIATAAHLTNDDTANWTRALYENNPFLLNVPSNQELRNARELKLRHKARDALIWIRDTVNEAQNVVTVFISQFCSLAIVKWLDEGAAKRACIGIVAANTVVWLCWQIPRLRPFMIRNFMHDPLSGRSHTLLTSIFSHRGFIHLAANNYALLSFGAVTYVFLGRFIDSHDIVESTPLYHFLAFFVTAGLFSNFLAHAIRLRVLYPRLVSQFTKKEAAAGVAAIGGASVAAASGSVTGTLAAPTALLPSLGSSGAIYATLIFSAMSVSDLKATFIFFPSSINFSLSSLASFLVIFDAIGVIRGWRYLDHLAHLGGALFGFLYSKFGYYYWYTNRYYLWDLLHNDSDVDSPSDDNPK